MKPGVPALGQTSRKLKILPRPTTHWVQGPRMTQLGHQDLSPGIKLFFQMGNFFIMDSETLVSNAYHESQNDALNEVYKRNTITEKLTSTKNNVCERRYVQTLASLEGQRLRRMKQLLEASKLLRDEVALLDLDKQRNAVHVRRRMQPERDFSYHDNHIGNAEKRLGVRTAPCYLDRTQRYPVRLRSVKDSSITPTIRRARASLRLRGLHKSKEENEEEETIFELHPRGLHRAQTMPINTAARMTQSKRFAFSSDSKDHRTTPEPSGPTCATPAPKNHGQKEDPNTSEETDSRMSRPVNNRSANYKSSFKLISLERPPRAVALVQRQVKVARDCHASFKVDPRSTKDLVNLLDDDSTDLPDDIDLQEHFFGNSSQNNKDAASVEESNRNGMNQTSLKFKVMRRAKTRLSVDAMRAETGYIQARVRKFVKDLQQKNPVELTDAPGRTAPGRTAPGRTAPGRTAPGRTAPGRTAPGRTAPGRTAPGRTASRSETPEICDRDTSSKFASIKGRRGALSPQARSPSEDVSDGSNVATSDHTGESRSTGSRTSLVNNTMTKGLDSPGNKLLANRQAFVDNESRDRAEENKYNANESNEHADTTVQTSNNMIVCNESPNKTTRTSRYSWRHIQGRTADGILRGSYSTEDLVLQTLTGIPIKNVLQTPVPLHTASRALRHTATYRMHKIVDMLIKDRTRYQKHEVNALKLKMADELQGKIAVDGEASASEDRAQVKAS